MLQGVAQRWAQFDFIFVVLLTPLSCSKMSLFDLKTCTPLKGRPEAPFELEQALRDMKSIAAGPLRKGSSSANSPAVLNEKSSKNQRRIDSDPFEID